MRLLLQFPEGLKTKALEEASKYEKEGHEVFISASPCWGACDLAIDEAKKIGADKLIHYGHAQFHKADFPVEYKLYPITVPLDSLKNSLPKLKKFGKIALVTTVSHIHQLGGMKEMLASAGHDVLTSKGGLAILEGQVLGCDSSAADKLAEKADAILYFGGGEFHPLGISSAKPVFAINPYANSFEHLNSKLEMKRKKERGMLIAASMAKTIGIILSTKSGQYNLKIAENIARQLRKEGKSASILVTAEVDFSALADFNAFDAYITTACPRLVDDSERFCKPVVNVGKVPELLKLIKETRE